MQGNQENKLSYEARQALEMIRQSKYFKGINKVTMLHAKYLNTKDIQEATKIIDEMIQVIVNS